MLEICCIPCFIALIISNILALFKKLINKKECLTLSLIACILPFTISVNFYRCLVYALLGIILFVVKDSQTVTDNGKNISCLMISSSIIVCILGIISNTLLLGYYKLIYFGDIMIPIFLSIILINIVLFRLSLINKNECIITSLLSLLLKLLIPNSATIQLSIYLIMGLLCLILKNYNFKELRLKNIGISIILASLIIFVIDKITLYLAPLIWRLRQLNIIK